MTVKELKERLAAVEDDTVEVLISQKGVYDEVMNTYEVDRLENGYGDHPAFLLTHFNG